MMTAAMVIVRLLALSALVGGCACFVHHVSPPGPSCVSLEATHTATMDDTQNTVLDADFLRVPVAIRLMVDPTPNLPTSETWWTPAQIGTYFGVGNKSINAAWAPAKIHFDLVRVERCVYTPPAGTYRVLTSGVKAMYPPDRLTLRAFPPSAQQAIIDHYLQVNIDFGISRTLNVYLWRNLSGLVVGYGESPRRNRIEVQTRHLEALSTLWYESELGCSPRPEGRDTCQIGIAHEIGHALGLSHSCYDNMCCTNLCWAPADYYFQCSLGVASSQQWTNWCPCEGEPGSAALSGLNACGDAFVACGMADANLARLMYPVAGISGASGFTLCQGEIDSARAGVRDFF